MTRPFRATGKSHASISKMYTLERSLRTPILTGMSSAAAAHGHDRGDDQRIFSKTFKLEASRFGR